MTPHPQQFVAVVGHNAETLVDSAASAFKFVQAGETGSAVIVSAFTVTSSVAVTSSGAVSLGPFTNPGARGMQLFLDVDSAASSAAASPTLDITVQGVDSVSGSTYSLPGASFTQVTTSTSTEVMLIHPHTTNDSGTGFRRRPGVVPPTWNVSVSAQSLSSGSTGATYEYTIGGVWIP